MKLEEIKLKINQTDLKELNKYLKNNLEIRLVESVILSKNEALDIYSTRYNIQKDVTHSNIVGYEYLLDKMNKSKAKEILIQGIYTKLGYYALFFESLTKEFLGFLFNESKKI